MAWEYDQSSGVIRLKGACMGQGYAGTGGGRDNPDMEDVGPIPRGTYDTGTSRRHPSLGPEVMNLDPVGHNDHGGLSSDFMVIIFVMMPLKVASFFRPM